MNIVLAGTVIIIAIFGFSMYMLNNIETRSIGTNISDDINNLRNQESVDAQVSGNDVIIVNEGKDTSQILKYRFYDDNQQLIKEIPADSIGGGMAHSQVLIMF